MTQTTALQTVPHPEDPHDYDPDDDDGGLCACCGELISFFGIREQDYVDGDFGAVMNALRGFKAAHDAMRVGTPPAIRTRRTAKSKRRSGR